MPTETIRDIVFFVRGDDRIRLSHTCRRLQNVRLHFLSWVRESLELTSRPSFPSFSYRKILDLKLYGALRCKVAETACLRSLRELVFTKFAEQVK